jgi:hypothetical protein
MLHVGHVTLLKPLRLEFWHVRAAHEKFWHSFFFPVILYPEEHILYTNIYRCKHRITNLKPSIYLIVNAVQDTRPAVFLHGYTELFCNMQCIMWKNTINAKEMLGQVGPLISSIWYLERYISESSMAYVHGFWKS